MKLLWFGKPRFWAINSHTLRDTGCRLTAPRTGHFDIHIESPAYDIDNRRFVSVMINVRGDRPKGAKKVFPGLNMYPIYSEMYSIPWDIYSVAILETFSFSEIRKHDCIWIHYFKRDFDIQVVPNSMKVVELFSTGILDVLKGYL